MEGYDLKSVEDIRNEVLNGNNVFTPNDVLNFIDEIAFIHKSQKEQIIKEFETLRDGFGNYNKQRAYGYDNAIKIIEFNYKYE